MHCDLDTYVALPKGVRYPRWVAVVVDSTLALGSICHGFESEHRYFHTIYASAFSKLTLLS